MTSSAARSKNLAKGSQEVHEKLKDVYDRCHKGYDDQQERASDIASYWRIWNCELDQGSVYKGRNRLYAPFCFEAIQARATRFVNQLFPQSDRHVEAASEDGTIPRAGISLREQAYALSISGDVEGQYNVYVDWEVSNRRTVSRAEKPVKTDEGNEVPGEKVVDLTEEDKPTGG